MEKHIQVFNNTEFGEIRTMEINGEPWFVGKDIATALGYAKPENAVSNHVDSEDKTSTLIQGSGSNYKSKAIIINESGMYSLVLSSKLEGAKRFKRWVTSEILPSIRKTGAYATDSAAAEYKARELRIREMNAQARLINAETRRLTVLQKGKGLSQVAVDTLAVKAVERVTGKDLGDYLPQVEKTYSASEIGNALGITAAKVGRLANAHGLKTDEYGITVMDKSRYSSKEVAAFRYNEHGKQKIKEILEGSK